MPFNIAKLGAVSALALPLLAGSRVARASDHGDAPLVAQDQGADIGDEFLFLDPNDNTKVVMAFDVHGFIVPAENTNFGHFDPTVRFRFNISNTGQPAPDMTIDVSFTPLVTTTTPQTATIHLSTGQVFTALTTAPSTTSATAPAQTITTDPTTGISFFAGQTDDPFFFDIVAFDRFEATALAGAPNTKFFRRGRDSFAGYNINMIAMDVPLSLIRGAGNNTGIGLFTQTQRRRVTVEPAATRPYNVAAHGVNGDGADLESGHYRTLDRIGNPAVNIVFIPPNMKDEYNRATPVDDAAGMFAPYIVATAQKLGVDQTHINVLASLAVTKGDYLRLDTTVANTGNGGGVNAAAAYPNGRRPGDDVISTLLTVINNGTTLSQGLTGNDVPFQNAFPFFALPHQPLPAGSTDDTQN